MSNLVRLHDMALDFEIDIEQSFDAITDYRIKMIDKRDPQILKSIIPVLDTLIYEAQQYKEWLQELK